MHVRWTRGTRPLRPGTRAPGTRAPRPLRFVVVVTAGALALALAGCGGAPKAASPQACGAGRTSANVPIEIEVNHGQVSCAVAVTVEKSYAAAIVAGRAPGNGGGGPITVNGWKCQGFSTPDELKTGDVSQCAKDGIQIVAILKS